MSEDQGKNKTPSVAKKEKEEYNEYITPIVKKIRSLNKKVQNIQQIEKKLAEKVPINEDQKKLLVQKDFIEKTLQEFEQTKAQLVKTFQEVSCN